MAELKLTKSEQRAQRVRLAQLQRYLPTLQLKKAMLQAEVNEVRIEIKRLEDVFHEKRLSVSDASGLLSEKIGLRLDLSAKVKKIQKRYENIAGVDIPVYEGVVFEEFEYNLFDTPAWVDPIIVDLRSMAEAKAAVFVAEEKKILLERELREVTIRVNLFEKNLIPKALQNIRKIKVFLGDQELAAVSQAKVAKAKIIKRKKLQEDTSLA
jgi:V/A-type H+-transporting ATPase subunit D